MTVKSNNHIDNILIDRQRHLLELDVRTFRAADFDTDHYMMVAKVREILAVNEPRSQTFHVDKLTLKIMYL
jgi:hypothetical protein